MTTFNNDYPNGYTFYEWTIRPDMVQALERYVRSAYPVGDFLRAVLTNDLMKACGHADSDNKRNLPAFAGYLYNVAPMGCHGSKERFEEWNRVGGLEGLQREYEEQKALKQRERDSNGNSDFAANESAIREREERS